MISCPASVSPTMPAKLSGFDADVCRAVAAAILGDASKVNFRPVVAADRQTVLQSGEVDMLSRNTTWTLSRDTGWGVTFAPTTFYDGQGVMVMADSGVTRSKTWQAASSAPTPGRPPNSTSPTPCSNRGLDFQLQTFQDFNAVMATFLQGGCDAVTTDNSGLVSRKATAPDPGALTILDVVLSKEPLGPLSPAERPAVRRHRSLDGLRDDSGGRIRHHQHRTSTITSADGEATSYNRVGATLRASSATAATRRARTSASPTTSWSRSSGRSATTAKSTTATWVRTRSSGCSAAVNNLWTNGGLLYSPPFR